MSLIQPSCEVRSFALCEHVSRCVALVCQRYSYEADHLHAPSIEFRLQFRKCTKLGGADWSVICGMREKDSPFAVDELVEVDVAG
jgi:hypothetical protein